MVYSSSNTSLPVSPLPAPSHPSIPLSLTNELSDDRMGTTSEALTNNHDIESGTEIASSIPGRGPRVGGFVHEVVVSEVIEQKTGFEKLLNRITVPTSVPMEREAAALRIPRPTAIPSLQKRQEDGQIQALSAQLQSLSQSATGAISSVSSSASSILSQMSQSAQSVRQSADQVIQSANQAADQANRQLSQTASSASSAVSAADARASSQISQSLASMSSRFSTSLASAQSSASDAVSSARVAASQFAASQIQAAAASGVRGDTTSPVEQTRSSSVSATTLAIIIVVSIVGTAILSTVATYLLLRYRRKKRATRGEKALADNERSIAVRGSPSPRFPRFGGGSGSTVDEFKLPRLSPLLRSKKAEQEARDNSGSAASGYSDQEESISSKQDEIDLDDAQPFRLQKDNGVSSATTVRLIRVGSEKGKARSSIDIQPTIPEPTPPLPMVAIPYQSLKPTLISTQNQPTTQSPSQAETIITQPPKSKEPPTEERRVSTRSTGTSDTEKPGWRPSIRPSVRLTATDPNRFRFRDSSDLESGEPTPTNPTTRLSSNPNTLSLRTPRTSNPPGQMNRRDFRRTAPPGQPKNGKGTFATFPRIRNEPPRESMMNRGRPRLENRPVRLRGDEERRLRDLAYMSGSMDPRRNTLNYR
ncbi:hypothetical protein FHL15_006271 [Xylaria flabelliformis]|uniref:Uncharacterized protein n=1 Tax=Xylaria flabelliformis TaxID=2512241 RepID=A0A553HY33_9PEZI|nr:hypothetical protein FHL15_006271 [Xylaria flabelliformis]